MTKILVAEDDDYFRIAIAQYLKSKRFEVFEAPNGKVAKDVLAVGDIDIIIADVQMPFFDGLELLHWVKANRSTSFILMTGFTNLLETKAAYEIGADDFLAKPFKNEELIAAIKNVESKRTGPKLPSNELSNENQFCKVSIEEFVSKPQIDFDVYIKLSDTKFVKIGHKGDSIPTARIKQYKEKGVLNLHIRREEFGKLVDFNLQIMSAIKGNNKISHQKKSQFMKFTGETILEKAFIEGVDKESYDDARIFLTTSVGVITEAPETFELLSVLNNHSDFIYAHSLGVSLYAIMIARKMNYTSSQLFFKLGMAGIFHDVGKKEIPTEVLIKPRPLLTQQERTLIETHATRSKEILMAIKGIPSDVVQLVYEHHEDLVGQGYPNRLVKNQLHPLSKILIVANLFVERAIRGPNTDMQPAGLAIRQIESMYHDRIDKQVLQALKDIFPRSAQALPK